MLGDAEEALDVCQEAFIKVWQNLTPKHPVPDNFRTWLYRITCNLCLNQRRNRQRREARVVLMESDGHDVSADPHKIWEARIWEEAARQAIDALPAQQRAVFVLKHFEELNTSDIAAAVGCSEATVRVHLSRAAATLRQQLSEDPAASEESRHA
jgi:RNA polymerase sigma-70 factor (ECF subfamily)